MKVFLFAVFFTVLSIVGANSNIPGLSTGIGRGYDLVYSTSKAPILKWNYNENNAWTFPLTASTYNVPDEVWVTNEPESTFTSDNVIVRNFSEYVEEQAKWHHMSIGIPGVFSFGMDKESKAVQGILEGGNKTVFVVTRVFTLFGIATWPYDTLDNQQSSPFQAQAAHLPSTNDKAAYDAFIKIFGTHYVPQSSFGGSYTYIVAVDNALFKKYSESWVKKQVSISVSYDDITFGFHWGSEVSKQNISQEFIKNSHTQTFWHGGSQEAFEKDFPTWYKTIIENPDMVSPYVVSVSHLLPNGPKRSNLEEAVQRYLNTPPNPTGGVLAG